jgi:hypothetical protein
VENFVGNVMLVSREFSEDMRYCGMLQHSNVISPFSSLTYASPRHGLLKHLAIGSPDL